MFQTNEQAIEWLKKNVDAYIIFMCLGEASSYPVDFPDARIYRQETPISLQEAMNAIKQTISKSESVIKSYIDKFASNGLIRYIADGSYVNPENTNLANDNMTRGFNSPKIQLSNDNPVSGIRIYETILQEIENKKQNDDALAKLQKALESVSAPYEKELQTQRAELEEKINEVNKSLEAGTIKSIQVLSVFAGIMALLFTNVLGIKEFQTLGAMGLLIINSSTVTSVFCLLVFSTWLVSGQKITLGKFFACIGLLVILILPIVFVNVSAPPASTTFLPPTPPAYFTTLPPNSPTIAGELPPVPSPS